MVDNLDKIKKLTDQLSVSELGDLITSLEEEREHRRQTARTELLAELNEKAASLGLSARQLVLGEDYEEPAPARRKYTRRAPAAEVPTAPEAPYRDSEGNTWSGKGRLPKWIKEAESNGRSRDQFKVASKRQSLAD